MPDWRNIFIRSYDATRNFFLPGAEMKVLGIVAVIVLLLTGAWLKLRGPDIPYAILDAKYAGRASHFVDLPGGFRVHYEVEGDPALPLLLLLHGFGDSFTSWESWAKELQGKFRLIALDLPGHGLTRAPEDIVLTGDGLADFVDAFAAQLALPRFAVAGNSLGGCVAWQLALRHPERINALILVDAAGFPNAQPPGKIPLAFKILKYPIGRLVLRNIDNRPLIEQALKTDVYDKSVITPAFVDRWAEFQRAPGHRAILMSVNFATVNRASTATLHDIHVPTLVLQGEEDPLIEAASARKFAAAIPGAKLVIYPYVGHLPQIEIPSRSAADVAEFLLGAH
jgi:pimeloyl-ACP methyl ester carboxylesterase